MSAEIGYVIGDLDFSDYRFPTTACVVHYGEHREFAGESDTVYGFACGGCELITTSGVFILRKGMFFCVPTPLKIIPLEDDSGVLAICNHGYRGMLSIGGPIEDRGRLRYIDGCSDTLLICPPRLGEPCLNHLHFPKNISQTMHTHPSIRVGVVASGNGRCVTPENEFPLHPGMLWLLPEDTPHCFFTDDETMDVIAWHPDSDTGPSDDDHPMVNRTIVDGVSASGVASIRTTGEIKCD